jgi:hypothetical protein
MIFLICPVRIVTEEELKTIESFVEQVEKSGKKIYCPFRDTNQVDETGGYRICRDNYHAMSNSTKIYIWWNKNSLGSHFDLGMAFVLNKLFNKKIFLVNDENIEETDEKSFLKVIKKISSKLDEE